MNTIEQTISQAKLSVDVHPETAATRQLYKWAVVFAVLFAALALVAGVLQLVLSILPVPVQLGLGIAVYFWLRSRIS